MGFIDPDEPPAPQGTSYVHYEKDGEHRVMAPGDPVCDFCCRNKPVVLFRAGYVDLPHHPVMTASNDEWGACDPCRVLVEAGDLNGLVRYSIKAQRRRIYELRLEGHDLVMQPDAANKIREQLEQFLAARMGPPIRIEPFHIERRAGELALETRVLRDGTEGMEAVAMIVGHVDGAIGNGERIKKVAEEEGDTTPLGSLGTVLSSIRDEEVSPHVFYFVEWDHTPGLPVGIIEWKVERA